jgi:hypothetical protein
MYTWLARLRYNHYFWTLIVSVQTSLSSWYPVRQSDETINLRYVVSLPFEWHVPYLLRLPTCDFQIIVAVDYYA